MRFRQWAAAAAVIGSALLTACGGSSSDTADVRLVNASAGFSSLDLTIDSKSINTSVAYGTAGSYKGVDPSATTTQILNNGTTVKSSTPTLTSGNKYSLIAYGWSGSMATTLLQESEDAPDSGYAKLLVLNLATDAGALDIYVTSSSADLSAASPFATNISGGSGSGYITTTSGTYRIRITGVNDKTDLRLDIPTVALDSTKVQTLIITPTQGGVLVNAIMLVQQSTVTSYVGTNSRVRVVGGIPAGAKVSGTRDSTALLATSTTPAIGTYSTVASGTGVVNITVNGTAMTARSNDNLLAGYDYTYLVWGTAASPQVTLLTDDNRLPTTSGYAKFNVVNAVTGLTDDGMTLLVDDTAYLTGVLPGKNSLTSKVPASTSTTLGSDLSIESPTLGVVLSNSSQVITSLGVYSVFLFGDTATVKDSSKVRKER